MKRLTLAAGLAICAVSFTSDVALARSGPGGHDVTFETIDADGDGQITRGELEDLRARHMATVDANGDGALSLEELEAAGTERAKSRAKKMMERLDANKDGVLGADELPKERRAARRFDRIDADGDGAISKAEFDAARERGGKRRHKVD